MEVGGRYLVLTIEKERVEVGGRYLVLTIEKERVEVGRVGGILF